MSHFHTSYSFHFSPSQFLPTSRGSLSVFPTQRICGFLKSLPKRQLSNTQRTVVSGGEPSRDSVSEVEEVIDSESLSAPSPSLLPAFDARFRVLLFSNLRPFSRALSRSSSSAMLTAMDEFDLIKL